MVMMVDLNFNDLILKFCNIIFEMQFEHTEIICSLKICFPFFSLCFRFSANKKIAVFITIMSVVANERYVRFVKSNEIK